EADYADRVEVEGRAEHAEQHRRDRAGDPDPGPAARALFAKRGPELDFRFASIRHRGSFERRIQSQCAPAAVPTGAVATAAVAAAGAEAGDTCGEVPDALAIFFLCDLRAARTCCRF